MNSKVTVPGEWKYVFYVLWVNNLADSIWFEGKILFPCNKVLKSDLT